MGWVMPPFWALDAYYRTGWPHATAVLVTPPEGEPVTLEDCKLRARITDNDEDALIADYIRAARAKVEQDTGLSLLTQTYDVYFDTVPYAGPILLPAQCQPLQSVTSIKSTDTAGVVQTLSPSQYVVDLASGRIGLVIGGSWPTDVRPFQPYVIRIVAGWTAVDLIPPPLVHAVGLLAAHYATLGRDLASVDSATEIPMGYTASIGPFTPVTMA